jgi:hypothetical protein
MPTICFFADGGNTWICSVHSAERYRLRFGLAAASHNRRCASFRSLAMVDLAEQQSRRDHTRLSGGHALG